MTDTDSSLRYWIDMTVNGFYEYFLMFSSSHYKTFWKRFHGPSIEFKQQIINLIELSNKKRQLDDSNFDDVILNELEVKNKYIKIE